MEQLTELATLLASLGGLSALFTFLVNIGKYVGIVKDGTSSTWHTGLNLVALVVLFAAPALSLDIPHLDGVAQQVAQIGTLILGLVVQIKAGQATHDTVAGRLPVLGYSYTQG